MTGNLDICMLLLPTFVYDAPLLTCVSWLAAPTYSNSVRFTTVHVIREFRTDWYLRVKWTKSVVSAAWTKAFYALQMNNMDPDLKDLFVTAGVTEKDMQDKDKAQFIYDFIEKQGGIEAVKK